MPISIGDFIVLGDELSSRDDEPAFRSGISRSYYAAYHRCKVWHETLDFQGDSKPPPGAKGNGKHQQLVNALKQPSNHISADARKRSRWIGGKLDILRLMRSKADYDLHETMTAAEAQNVVLLVKGLLPYCDEPISK